MTVINETRWCWHPGDIMNNSMFAIGRTKKMFESARSVGVVEEGQPAAVQVAFQSPAQRGAIASLYAGAHHMGAPEQEADFAD